MYFQSQPNTYHTFECTRELFTSLNQTEYDEVESQARGLLNTGRNMQTLSCSKWK